MKYFSSVIFFYFVSSFSFLFADNFGDTHFISVKNFGAIGDGLTDDTDAIKRAADKFNTSGTNSVLYFDPGIYRTKGLVIPFKNARCSIKGISRYGTQIINAKIIFENSDCSIENLHLLGSGTGIAILCGDPTGKRRRSIVSSCWIQNYDIGILQNDNGAFLNITDTFLELNISANIKIDASPYIGRGDVVVSNCQLFGAGVGIWIKSCGTMTISDTKIQGNKTNVYIATENKKDKIRQIYFNATSIEDAAGSFSMPISSFCKADYNKTKVILEYGNSLKIGENARGSITGTNKYNNRYWTISNVNFAEGTFEINTPYKGNESNGTFSMPGWDIHIEASEEAGARSIDDIVLTNGDVNNIYLERGLTCQFYGTLVKRFRWISDNFKDVAFITGLNRENTTNLHVPVSGRTKGVFSSSFENNNWTMSFASSGQISINNNSQKHITTPKKYGVIFIVTDGKNENRAAILVYTPNSLSPIFIGTEIKIVQELLSNSLEDNKKLLVSISNGIITVRNMLGEQLTFQFVFLT